jgi:hypothetical protein
LTDVDIDLERVGIKKLEGVGVKKKLSHSPIERKYVLAHKPRMASVTKLVSGAWMKLVVVRINLTYLGECYVTKCQD